jgi:2OG-Fe(II) oxygenase superfamily/ShK domain-like
MILLLVMVVVVAFLPATASRQHDEAMRSSCVVVDEHGNEQVLKDGTCFVNSAAAAAAAPAEEEGGDDDKALDLGVEQVYPPGLGDKERALMGDRLGVARRYLADLRNTTMNPDDGDGGFTSCLNARPHCLLWSVRDECRKNPTFMREKCGPVCHACYDGIARRQRKARLDDELVRLGADFGMVQLTRGPEDYDRVVQVLDDARSYLRQLGSDAASDSSCYLKHHDCAHWALKGYCRAAGASSSSSSSSSEEDAHRHTAMIRLCAPLCRACPTPGGIDDDDDDDDDDAAARRPSTEAAINRSLGHDLGVVQDVFVPEAMEDEGEDAPVDSDSFQLEDLLSILSRIMKDRTYLEEDVKKDAQLAGGGAGALCRNRHEHCTAWAMLGECQANVKFMTRECPVACHTCDRCRKDPNGTDVWKAGDQDRMFERILTDPEYRDFQPRALSRPTYAPGDTAENATYQIGMWLVLFDQLLTEEEAAELLEEVQKRDFNPSRVLSGFENSQAVNRESKARTSHQTWCMDDCHDHPAHRRMVDRISNITGIPEINFEATQVPRYLEGQYYHRHNDCILQHEFLPFGPRILTAFVYLNHVEAGGGTTFPVLNLTAMPKPGRAVLWPSVHNDRPNSKDSRADHAALVVEKGIKYGANIWIHQRDYKTPHDNDCS